MLLRITFVMVANLNRVREIARRRTFAELAVPVRIRKPNAAPQSQGYGLLSSTLTFARFFGLRRLCFADAPRGLRTK